MPSAKKKKQKQKAKNRAKKTAGSSSGVSDGGGAVDQGAGGTSTTKVPPPRSNDDIVGNSYRTSAVPRRSIVRELEAALRYEAASESRRKIVDAVAALSANGAAPDDMDKIPLTYETKPMLDMIGGRCLLTYGKVSPFSVRQQSCPPGIRLAIRTGDAEDVKMAQRWTGEHPLLRLDFDVIVDTTRTDLSVYLGECFLRKDDLWKFAGKFKSGTGYDWPDYFSVVQCPFCCKMQLPSDPDGAGGRPERLIMIMTNISQFATKNGSMHMPHRALPRLCCVDCFASNLKSADEPALGPDGWKSYPEVLNHGIVWGSANSLVKEWVQKDDLTRESFLPDAHTLYMLYDESGMCSAVSQQIHDRQTEMMGRLSELMREKLSMS